MRSNIVNASLHCRHQLGKGSTLFLGIASSFYKPIKPILVAVDHRIGLGIGKRLGRFSLLSFLGKDTHAAMRQILN